MRSRRLIAFSLFPCGRVKRYETNMKWTQDFHCVFSEMKTQTFENAFVWTGPIKVSVVIFPWGLSLSTSRQ